jgi:ion channel POLLUX/CASTOR
MSNAPLRARWRYAFDEFMSKGTVALIFGLGVISLVFILVMAAVVFFVDIRPEDAEGSVGYFEAGWQSLMRTLDAGTMGGDKGWTFRIAMLVVTLGGIFVISTLIGLLTSGIEAKLEDLRRGRSEVIETDHTVILGWSQQIFAIITEIIEANASKSSACIVVLADMEKVEMEEELAARIPDRKTTKLVCRSGSPIDLTDLAMVSLNTSRSIIVLSPEEDRSDTRVIQTILAITNNPTRHAKPYHIVAELHNPKSVEVARMVGKDEVELILAGELIARIIAQTCRQSGLSVVYTELLDFGGDEMYFYEEKSLVGKTFGDSLSAFDDSAVLGLHRKGQALLNPPMDTVIQAGDKMIVVAEDDDAIQISSTRGQIDAAAIQLQESPPYKPERTLILGWNWRAAWIIRELDNYVAEGSSVTVVSTFPEAQEELDTLGGKLAKQKLEFKIADTTDRAVLNELTSATDYHHVIILCYDSIDVQAADARTLVTLLHLRDIASKLTRPFSIVTEMLDIRNRTLAEVAHPDDFVVSQKLISLLMAQISENKYLNAVFTDIFDPDGSEIYLKPAGNYVALGKPVNFYTVVEAARKKGHVALGYRISALSKDSSKAYGVRVNPKKGEMITLSDADKVIVLAEN